MDVSIPVMGGFSSLKQVSNSDHLNSEKRTIILLTAFSLEDFNNKIINEGFGFYLAKPSKHQVLNQVLVDFAQDE